MFYSNKKQKRTMKGFLLPEVILSLFILTIGIVTVVSLIASSLHESLGSRDIITATFLTQEGVELVRNTRDTGFVRSTATPINPFEKFKNQKHCVINYNDGYSDIQCTGSFSVNDYKLQYSGNFYTHSGGAGKFSRYMYIDYNNANKTALVRSFVYWGSSAPPSRSSGNTSVCTVVNKCVYTEISLTNWRP